MTRPVVQAAHYGLGSIFPVVVLDAHPRWHTPRIGALPEPSGEPKHLLVVRWTGLDPDIGAAPALLERAARQAPEDFTPGRLTRFKDGLPSSLLVTTLPATALLGPWAERPGGKAGPLRALPALTSSSSKE
ncbi:hypothetical protein ABZX75_02725 [Streptomyces sp. NPDC003038]|uniref:hypothetical protein n=1 Tax=unclassified Streptomyces TaxID=2593676 RepID=UPI0033A5540C